MTVAILWILSIVSTSSYFWDIRILVLWGKISVPLCLVVSGISYTKIFVTLRHNHIQVQDRSFQGQLLQTTLLNKARYRKAVSSALWVQLVLVFCYFPYTIAEAVTPQRGIPLSGYLAREFTKTLIFLNSSLNPLIYFWKMRELRQAVKNTLCCLSGQFLRIYQVSNKSRKNSEAHICRKKCFFLTSSVSVLKSTFENIRDTQNGISKMHLEKMLPRFTSSFSLLNSAFEYSLVERDERRITQQNYFQPNSKLKSFTKYQYCVCISFVFSYDFH